MTTLTNAAYFVFQMTVSASSLPAEQCITVNGAPERCGVMIQRIEAANMDSCLQHMTKEHNYWWHKINGDPEIKATGAVVWVRCLPREGVAHMLTDGQPPKRHVRYYQMK